MFRFSTIVPPLLILAENVLLSLDIYSSIYLNQVDTVLDIDLDIVLDMSEVLKSRIKKVFNF